MSLRRGHFMTEEAIQELQKFIKKWIATPFGIAMTGERNLHCLKVFTFTKSITGLVDLIGLISIPPRRVKRK